MSETMHLVLVTSTLNVKYVIKNKALKFKQKFLHG